MKNLVVIAVLFATVGVNAQVNELLAFNSEKKRIKIENKLAKLTAEIENKVRFEAPKVEEESNIVDFTTITFDDVQEMRSWIKTNFEKEALKNSCSGTGKAVLSFVVDLNGKVCNVEIEGNEDPQVKKTLLALMKKAPSVKPLKMNGYSGKQYVRIPINYRIELM